MPSTEPRDASRSVATGGDERALPPWRRFHVRITFLFGALGMLILAAMGVLSYRWARDTEISALQARLLGLAVALAGGLDADVVEASLEAGTSGTPAHARMVERFAAVGRDEEDIVSIYVLAPSEREGWLRFAADWVRTGTPGSVGELYDATERDRMQLGLREPAVEAAVYTDAWGPVLSGYAPIVDREGRAVAFVGVDVSAARVARLEEHALIVTGVTYGVALLVLLAAGLVLGRRVRRPIARVIEVSRAVASGDFGVRAQIEGGDELGILGRHFDRMARALEDREHVRAVFGRYLSEDVARRVLASPDAARLGGEERTVTVLFIGLARSSLLAEALDPAHVVELLEHYLSSMIELVDEHGGCVIEMLGDAVLAVFNAPADLEDHTACAVRCGIAMTARVEALDAEWEASGLAQRWKERGIDRLRAHIGIHVGTVVAGNTGGRTRMKYAVIGDAVNVAARIDALNERLGTTLLVSAEVHARLASGGETAQIAASCEERGTHTVKGRAQPVAVYAC